MRTTALCVCLCCASMTLLVSGCDDSGTGGSKSDGGGSEAGQPSDATGAGKDVPLLGTDARDVAMLGDGRVPGADGPAVVPQPDGGPIGPTQDAPLGGGEAGSATGIDGRPGEAGSLPPLIYPDGGLSCGLAGAVCQSAADCCGLACVANRCAAAACLSDGTVCAANGQCCSTQCGSGGTCVPLNPACKTAGNACATGADCCSGVCNASKQCAQPGQVSYCAQVGDICRADSQCCTGVCNIAAGAAAGTCATISTACVIDGTVCDGCGECCSRFCGPFGVGGPNICQPASGCHVQGDLCRQDTDCCGGDPRAGLPGAGLVKCELDQSTGSRIGTCGGPKASNCPVKTEDCTNACNPEGNVCHYKDTWACTLSSDSKRNNCCQCIPGKECCVPDRSGIPRCNTLTECVPAGGLCSFSAECCNNLPCVPDPVTGQLVCGTACIPEGGLCTTNADCCTGMLCEVTPGSLVGVCIIPPPPPVTTPDGGVIVIPDGAVIVEPDAGQPDLPPPPICAYFGQACSLDIVCCGGLPCIPPNWDDCTAADPICYCSSRE
jgi:hypothetical protein